LCRVSVGENDGLLVEGMVVDIGRPVVVSTVGFVERIDGTEEADTGRYEGLRVGTSVTIIVGKSVSTDVGFVV